MRPEGSRLYLDVMDLVAVGKRRYRKLRFLGDLLAKECTGTKKVDVPLKTRLQAWRHGFLSASASVYGLAENDWRDYLSDYSYYLKTPFINYGRYNAILNDKIYFYCMMRAIAAPTPSIFGFVVGRRLAWLDAPTENGAAPGLRALLEHERQIVLKPVNGGGGHGFFRAELADGRVLVNGEERDMSFVQNLLAPGTLVSEWVRQADYAAKINDSATNTIRILTMWDPQTDEPFVARAAHRFATRRSLPVDNFGKGGLSANMDLETGRLGPASSFPYTGRVERHSMHPDTGAQIEDVTVPGWPTVRDAVLRVSERLPQLPLVGWDVVVTDGGLSIIEGNSYPNPDVLQIHRPLLDDPRVRRFYQHHGVRCRPVA
jgi:hypothetical protein